MLIIIEGRLPGTNELISANRGSWQRGSHQKKDYTKWCAIQIKSQIKYVEVKNKPINLCITWYEPNKRRDHDNILCGLKFILDGMVKSGLIPDDSQKYIGDITSHIEVDKIRPRIEVEIDGVD